MPLSVGARLGHYTVTAKIGEGGMGEVYRARDTKENEMRAHRVRERGLILLIGLVCCALTPTLTAQQTSYDILIRGGRVVDGSGNPWFRGDVAIEGDRIVAVGRLGDVRARRVIDATGLMVAPGFIDLHTHSDMALLADGTAQSKVRQGVTLDVIGESTSVAPRDGLGTTRERGEQADWTTFNDYFERLERQGISLNLITHVSATQVRRIVMGYDSRPSTVDERQRMRELVARSMREGAWGLVTRFESGGPAHPNEIIEMAKIAAAYGGNYTSHAGSEGYEQAAEIDFAIRVAEEAQIPVHLFHFKIRGRENWGTIGQFIDQIQAARDHGVDITANQYPYTAMFHGWSSFFPLWARDGGPERFAERLNDPAMREKIKTDPDFIAWAQEHGWWEGIVMARASTPTNQQYEGLSVAEIAELRGDEDPADTCITLMAEEGGNISGIFHTMSEDDVRLVMRRPWVAVASDGSSINLDARGVPHPRNYATAARVLGHYVRDEGVLAVEDAVRKMSSLPAQILGLRDRGLIREGFAADVVVFDLNEVNPTNSFEAPKSYSVGVSHVFVNGVLVIDEGEHTGARPGRPIRGHGYEPD